jgi:uncharacterized protein YcsI (UPF0317 family)
MLRIDENYCNGVRAQAQEFRGSVRRGEYRTHTAGVVPSAVQTNLCILPKDWADEFLRFCRLNPKPCPVLAVSDPGDPMVPELGADIDIRTDLPMYRVFRDGVCVDEVHDITALWRDDLVTFAIGCSFSFEEALLTAGVPLRHIEQGTDIAMFRSNIVARPAGRFKGNLVVNVRPLKPVDAIRAIQITSRFPGVHGAPIHIGDPTRIGIADLDMPDFGDRVEVKDGELPVFWACGVTPQLVVEASKPPFCITHKASHMLVTDRLNSELAVF